MEAAAIVATITADPEILAAAILHDVVEDTDRTVEDLRAEFGDRIAELVASESEDPMAHLSEEASWHARKQAAIDRLANAPHDAKRAIARDHELIGDEIWNLFHTKEKSEHEWHYRGLAASLSDLSGTFAYREFVALIDQVFQK